MKHLLGLVLSCLTLLAFSQNCKHNISGWIEDKQHGERLPFASIYIEELKSGVLADDSGKFVIPNLCDGTYTLRIAQVGSHTLIKKLTINSSVEGIKLQLEHDAHDLHQVEISAHREEKVIGKTIEKLEGITLKKYQGDNLGNMVSHLSGVSVVQTGANIAKPVIHGMHSNRVLILNNGIRQEGQQWGAEHAPEIDPFIAKKISVVKGASTIRYGSDAIAGVILVEPGDLPDTNGITGEISLAGATNGRLGASSALVEGKLKQIKNFRFRLQGTLRRAGDLKTPDYYLDNTGLSEQNFSTAADYQYGKFQTSVFYSQFNTKIGIFTGSHLGNTSDLLELFANPVKPKGTEFSYEIGRPFQELHHELLKVNTRLSLNNFNTLSLTYSRQFNQRFEFDRHGPRNDSLAALNRPEFQYYITTHLLDLQYELHHHNHFEGMLGISGLSQANTYNGRYFIPNFKRLGIGAFWIERYHTGNWKFELGLRNDYQDLQVFKPENGVIINPHFTFLNPTANIGLNYKLGTGMDLSLYSGTAWRPPAVNELFSNGLHHGSATIETGNRNLHSETNWNNSLSFSVEREKMDFEVSLYHNIITGFINLVPSGQTSLTIRGAFPSYLYIQQNAIFRGVDAHARVQLRERLWTIAQLSVVRANERKSRNYLSLIPSDRLNFGFEKQLISKSNKTMSVVLQGIYQARQIRYARQIVIAQEDGTQLQISDFAPPPGEYFLLEAEVNGTIMLGGHEVFVSLSANNLLNRRYRNYLNRFRYFSDEAGRNIQLKINIPFNIKK